jgi:hypothetical protein
LFQFGHLPAKNHLTEFLSEPFDILGVVRGTKAFRKFEKSLLLTATPPARGRDLYFAQKAVEGTLICGLTGCGKMLQGGNPSCSGGL